MAPVGVVGMSEVVQPNSVAGKSQFFGTPAFWAYVWVGAAALFLFTVHLALLGRR